MATLRPLSSRSRNSAAVNCAVRRLGREFGGNFHHFRHGAAKKEMIVRHLVDLAEAAEQLEQPPDVALPPRRSCRRCRGRAAAEIAPCRQSAVRCRAQRLLIGGGQACCHAPAGGPRRRPARPRAAAPSSARPRRRAGAGSRGSSCKPQPFPADALQIGIIGVIAPQALSRMPSLKLRPAIRRQRDLSRARTRMRTSPSVSASRRLHRAEQRGRGRTRSRST